MAFEKIEKIKQEYTDKYVVVDNERPELARFGNYVGQVKTVNMSGRALVEFLDYHLNSGWHDINLDYLKVVDKPEPKAEKPAAKKPAAKPAPKKPAAGGEKKLSPLEMARMQGAGGKSATAKPAAKKPAAGKMSTADILAQARGGKAAPAAKSEPKAEPAAAEPEPETAPEPVADTPTAAAESDGPVKVDRASMSVDAMLAYCREHDG